MPLSDDLQTKLEIGRKAAADKDLAEAAQALAAQDPQDVGYTSKLFVQALFPYRETQEKERVIESSYGKIVVYSSAGLPSGKYPRLIMAYIITRAVENAGRLKEGKIDLAEACRIPLGHSMNAFLQAIGISTRANGGRRGNLTKLREQLLRISGSMITVRADNGVHARGQNTQLLEEWNLWFDTRDPNQGSLIESYLVLTPQFFQHIADSPIPIDLNVLRQLNKPRAMDIYIWTTLKQYWLYKNGRDAYTFTWDTVGANFAATSLETAVARRDFRNEVKKAINDILTVWPTCGLKADSNGVTVKKTAPSVELKRPRLQIDQ